MDGSCKGTEYSDSFGTWSDVVVQAFVKITLRDYTASVKMSSDQIILRSGLRCPISAGFCLDSDDGYTFWTAIPQDSCHFHQYDVLYEGNAIRLSPRGEETGPIMYTVTDQETTFALTRTTSLGICGYNLIRTEHPKLFVLEATKGNTFKSKTRISVSNLDLFTYVNSKFVYVEKHIRSQMTHLYRDVLEQKCALERQVLKNALAFAQTSPDEVAFSVMKGPGFMAVTAGEVIHIIKCVPVQVALRKTEDCYKELPVSYQNHTFFLTPKTRILTTRGTQRSCNELLPVMYQTNNLGYQITPKPIESKNPQVIQPLTQPKWRYINPSSLATSGIYSSEDIEKLRDHIMFPMEQPAMLNTLARGAMGHEVPGGSIRMYNLLDEETLQKIAQTTGQRIWAGFITFGSASAGVMAVYIICRVIKLIVDTVIHGYALHSIYGWSIHLLGSTWDSLTNLLLYLGHRGHQAPVPTSQHEDIECNDSKSELVPKVIPESAPPCAHESVRLNSQYPALSQMFSERKL